MTPVNYYLRVLTGNSHPTDFLLNLTRKFTTSLFLIPAHLFHFYLYHFYFSMLLFLTSTHFYNYFHLHHFYFCSCVLISIHLFLSFFIIPSVLPHYYLYPHTFVPIFISYHSYFLYSVSYICLPLNSVVA